MNAYRQNALLYVDPSLPKIWCCKQASSFRHGIDEADEIMHKYLLGDGRSSHIRYRILVHWLQIVQRLIKTRWSK